MNINIEDSEPHDPDCDAIEMVEKGIWKTPWTFASAELGSYDREEEEFKDEVKLNMNLENKNYVVLKCNDTECNGRLQVATQDLLKKVPNDVGDII